MTKSFLVISILAFFLNSATHADPNDDLAAALWSKDLGAVEAALGSGADARALDSDLNSWLHIAVIAEFDAVLPLLVAAGVPVDGVDRTRCTALHVAASNGRKTAVTWLLGQGINPNLPDSRGNRANDLARLARFDVIAHHIEQRQAEIMASQPRPQPAPRVRPSLLSHVFDFLANAHRFGLPKPK